MIWKRISKNTWLDLDHLRYLRIINIEDSKLGLEITGAFNNEYHMKLDKKFETEEEAMAFLKYLIDDDFFYKCLENDKCPRCGSGDVHEV